MGTGDDAGGAPGAQSRGDDLAEEFFPLGFLECHGSTLVSDVSRLERYAARRARSARSRVLSPTRRARRGRDDRARAGPTPTPRRSCASPRAWARAVQGPHASPAPIGAASCCCSRPTGCDLGMRFGMTGVLLHRRRRRASTDCSTGPTPIAPSGSAAGSSSTDGRRLLLHDPRRLGARRDRSRPRRARSRRVVADATRSSTRSLRVARGDGPAIKARLLDQSARRRGRQPAGRRDPLSRRHRSAHPGRAPRRRRSAPRSFASFTPDDADAAASRRVAPGRPHGGSRPRRAVPARRRGRCAVGDHRRAHHVLVLAAPTELRICEARRGARRKWARMVAMQTFHPALRLLRPVRRARSSRRRASRSPRRSPSDSPAPCARRRSPAHAQFSRRQRGHRSARSARWSVRSSPTRSGRTRGRTIVDRWGK